MNTRPGLVLMLQEERRAHAVTSDHLAAKSRLVIDQAGTIRAMQRRLDALCAVDIRTNHQIDTWELFVRLPAHVIRHYQGNLEAVLLDEITCQLRQAQRTV